MERSYSVIQHGLRPARHSVYFRLAHCRPQALLAFQHLPQRQLPFFKQHILLFRCGLPLRPFENLPCCAGLDTEGRRDLWQWRTFAHREQRRREEWLLRQCQRWQGKLEG